MTEDPFSRPTSGNFPPMEDLEGSLLLIKPVRVEVVPANPKFGGKPGETRERATADVTVFGPEGHEFYSDMYLSQAVLLGACKSALKPGAKPFVLGRLAKVATKATQEEMKTDNTPEAYAVARAEWLKKGGKGKEPKHVWVLLDFTDEDAVRVREYLAAQQKATDPFQQTEG